MRGYARVASVSLLMMGLLATPNPSSAKDGDGKHHLLNSDLRSKIEHIRDRVEDRREQHHHNNEGGVPGSITVLQTEVAKLKADLAGMVTNEASLLSQINTANTQISELTARLNKMGGGSTDPALALLAKYVKVVETGDLDGVKGPHVIFDKVNLHLHSGSNATNDNGVLTGLGNLIVGYNERQITPIVYDGVGCNLSAGSHNIVTGSGNLFTSYGGLLVGSNHCVTSPNTSILAGDTNEAHGMSSAILGGTRRGTTAQNSTVPVIR
jgi:hypothetical protein